MTFDMTLHPAVAMSGWDVRLADGVLAHAASLGYARVVVPLRGFERLDTRVLRTSFERHELSPVTAGNQLPDADISSDDEQVRERGASRLRRMVDFTREIGGDQISGVLYSVLGHASGAVTDERFARTAETLGRIADEAAGQGVRVVCEVVNRYETAMMNTAVRGVEFIGASRTDTLALHLDTFHMNIEERNPVEAIKLAMPHLAYIEIGQNDRGEVLGGAIDLAALVRSAALLGYKGRFGVEAFSANILEAPVSNALAVWRETFGERNRIAEDAIALVREAHASITEDPPAPRG